MRPSTLCGRQYWRRLTFHRLLQIATELVDAELTPVCFTVDGSWYKMLVECLDQKEVYYGS